MARMRITTLKLCDFRSFVEMDPIELGRINVFLGPNNAGKSSLLRAICTLQGGVPPVDADIRLGANRSVVEIGLGGVHGVALWQPAELRRPGTLLIDINGGAIHLLFIGQDGERRAVRYPKPQKPWIRRTSSSSSCR
jgi:AAA domain